jgi:hypothetical protein
MTSRVLMRNYATNTSTVALVGRFARRRLRDPDVGPERRSNTVLCELVRQTHWPALDICERFLLGSPALDPNGLVFDDSPISEDAHLHPHITIAILPDTAVMENLSERSTTRLFKLR